MSSQLKNLSSYNQDEVPSGEKEIFGIVVSEWNNQITDSLLEGAVSTLLKYEVDEKDIDIIHVPGSFELPFGAAKLLEKNRRFSAIICLGCVIQGETRHFDFICDAVANGIMELGLKQEVPIIFGVLTTNDLQQAIDRSGGKHGNKGVEAAITALKMAAL
ncbi:MAG: 6,7-dimethyl-8-ribityllumazine synthase [Bacteroidales bacterium]|jgi:6,7-dimethyl-8-ribityllumazine synthase|nr:6,7-dimethyl-8-ribityllumazine synthase [Bacteroidales bacterium]MEE0888708.1 6,7-dimethyl-8-ribityllumazine synthase [Bacteroidales bacterium]MEE1112195.1 6,7-dimethyl-8-ribityllumazine synthase [Bacteroidales bacterium]MEE1142250.1 6,7-dimethyl-8-ribityllumazine synthase [Bacteroidales bacterium]MEE1226753.1 6,7-dimethyl-8-ribityllumazine synthase [Bacteroidales bacterium]